MARINQASFLGIPPELRMRIYEFVFILNIKYAPSNGYGIRQMAGGNLQLPWLNTMLTCTTAAKEIRSLMGSAAFSASEVNTSYELDLQCQKFRLHSTKWLKIPCAPSQIRNLTVNFNAIQLDRFWGCGGPMTIVGELYQTLNLLLHGGPLLDRRRPLPQPMKLQRIVINFSTFPNSHADDQELLMIVRMLEDSGLLSGHVELVQVRGRLETHDVAIKHRDSAGVPEHWSGYGFEWGIGEVKPSAT